MQPLKHALIPANQSHRSGKTMRQIDRKDSAAEESVSRTRNRHRTTQRLRGLHDTDIRPALPARAA